MLNIKGLRCVYRNRTALYCGKKQLESMKKQCTELLEQFKEVKARVFQKERLALPVARTSASMVADALALFNQQKSKT